MAASSWLPRAERFVRHAHLAELAFVDLHREGFFYPSLGNSEEMVNSTFPCPIGTFFTQTHSPESRRWLPRAERFVRHALLAELAFVDLHREGFFYPSLGNSEEMVNSTFPCPIGTFFTQTHSPESRAPGRRPCEEAVGRPLEHLPLDVHRVGFFRFPLHRRIRED